MVAANLSLCVSSHLLTYCRSVGSELSSRGFWRYLYLYNTRHYRGVSEQFSEIVVEDRCSPPDKLVEDLDKLLYLIGLGGGLDLKEGEGRCGSLCVEVQAAGLEEPADDENVEEGVRIFEEFQRRSRLDEFVRDSVVVSWGDGFKVLVHLIFEYYQSARSVSMVSEIVLATLSWREKPKEKGKSRQRVGSAAAAVDQVCRHLPVGSCFACAFTAPFLALILTPWSEGLVADCC